MRRLRIAMLIAFLTGVVPGCGESQPNAPASDADLNNPNFGQSSGDMMKKANAGSMNPKNLRNKGVAPGK
jgi:hypothetical protein